MATTESEREAREKLEHLHVLVAPEVRDELAALAESEERSIGAVTRRVLRAGLESYEDGGR